MRLAVIPLILAAIPPAVAFAAPPGTTESYVLEIQGPPGGQQAVAEKLRAAAELADQNRRSDALNVEINRKNREVQARNDAKSAAFAKAMADYKSALAQHDADVAKTNAAAARLQADYDKQVAAWKAAVAACKKGDVSQCAQPPATAAAP